MPDKILPPERPGTPERPERRPVHQKTAFWATLTVLLVLLHIRPDSWRLPKHRVGSFGLPWPVTVDSDDFAWDLVPPSRDLEYEPCYRGRLLCARLLLPMDPHADPGHLWDHAVAIAMVKLPANVSVLDARYGGEIYFNPGKEKSTAAVTVGCQCKPNH